MREVLAHGPAPPGDLQADATSILRAAEIWYGIKKHWCIDTQRLIHIRRARGGKGV